MPSITVASPQTQTGVADSTPTVTVTSPQTQVGTADSTPTVTITSPQTQVGIADTPGVAAVYTLNWGSPNPASGTLEIRFSPSTIIAIEGDGSSDTQADLDAAFGAGVWTVSGNTSAGQIILTGPQQSYGSSPWIISSNGWLDASSNPVTVTDSWSDGTTPVTGQDAIDTITISPDTTGGSVNVTGTQLSEAIDFALFGDVPTWQTVINAVFGISTASVTIPSAGVIVIDYGFHGPVASVAAASDGSDPLVGTPGQDAIDTITISSDTYGGYFAMTDSNGNLVTNIPFNVDFGTLESALITGNWRNTLSVSGPDGGPYVIDWGFHGPVTSPTADATNNGASPGGNYSPLFCTNGQDAKDTVTVVATGGTFALTFPDTAQTISSIPYNVGTSTLAGYVNTALSISTASVTNPRAGVYLIDYGVHGPVTSPTADGSGLTAAGNSNQAAYQLQMLCQ